MGSTLFKQFIKKSLAKQMRGSGPPGPPPRQGLQWKPQTHRWIRPRGGETGSVQDEHVEEDIPFEIDQYEEDIKDYIKAGLPGLLSIGYSKEEAVDWFYGGQKKDGGNVDGVSVQEVLNIVTPSGEDAQDVALEQLSAVIEDAVEWEYPQAGGFGTPSEELDERSGMNAERVGDDQPVIGMFAGAARGQENSLFGDVEDEDEVDFDEMWGSISDAVQASVLDGDFDKELEESGIDLEDDERISELIARGVTDYMGAPSWGTSGENVGTASRQDEGTNGWSENAKDLVDDIVGDLEIPTDMSASDIQEVISDGLGDFQERAEEHGIDMENEEEVDAFSSAVESYVKSKSESIATQNTPQAGGFGTPDEEYDERTGLNAERAGDQLADKADQIKSLFENAAREALINGEINPEGDNVASDLIDLIFLGGQYDILGNVGIKDPDSDEFNEQYADIMGDSVEAFMNNNKDFLTTLEEEGGY